MNASIFLKNRFLRFSPLVLCDEHLSLGKTMTTFSRASPRGSLAEVELP